MDTTKANVLLIAPELSETSDELFTLVLADVAEEVTVRSYANGGIEIIQRYMVAHCLSIQDFDVQSYQSESIDKASRTRFSDNLNNTKYGAEVLRLQSKYRKLRGV